MNDIDLFRIHRARCRRDAAFTALSEGDVEGARRGFSLALREARIVLGGDHVELVALHHGLATAFDGAGDLRQAAVHATDALRIGEARLSRCDPMRATLLEHAAGLYRALGRYCAALPLHAALAAHPAVAGDEERRLSAMVSEAQTRVAFGDYTGAERLAEAVLAVRGTGPLAVRCEMALGVAALDRDRLDAAEGHFRRALDQASDADLGGLQAACLARLGVVRRREGRLADARTHLDAASLVATDEALLQAYLTFDRAELLRAQGRRAEAVRLHRDVLRRLWRRCGADSSGLVRSLLILAELCEDEDPAAARQGYERARRLAIDGLAPTHVMRRALIDRRYEAAAA